MRSVHWRPIKVATIVVTALAAAGGSAGAKFAAQPAATTASPWSQTNYNAAQSRANLAETILTRAKIANIVHLRAITIQPKSVAQSCSQQVDSLALPGSSVYAAGGGFVAKYNAASGRLLWRRSTSDASQGINDS